MEDQSWQIVGSWMQEYGDRIMRVVYLIIGEYHPAEEITQEVFVKAYNSMKIFRVESSPYTWLYRIAINLSKTYLNRRSKIRFLPLNEDIRAEVVTEPPDEKAVRAGIGRQIRECIGQLPVIYREVIILHYFGEMKIAEIAQVLEQPEGTVKSKLSRGRVLLEDSLRKEGLAGGE